MKKSQMARIFEFDRLVDLNKYPNRYSFSSDYEVSDRTVARDIEYLRDMLGAPLAYDRARNGYYYSEPWSLPTVVTLSSAREDRISLLIEELKGLNCSEREFVLTAAGLYKTISRCASHGELFHQAVA